MDYDTPPPDNVKCPHCENGQVVRKFSCDTCPITPKRNKDSCTECIENGDDRELMDCPVCGGLNELTPTEKAYYNRYLRD